MERLTKRYTYNGKPEISVDSEINGISCSNFCTNCGKADCDDIRKALFKLAEYEDLEEQGKLLKLPCAVGDTVYVVERSQIGSPMIAKTTADSFYCALWMLDGKFGRSIFTTPEAAESALKEL